MFKLDNNFLVSLGLGGLPVEEKNRLLQMIYERLEMNVGMRLAEKMTDQQLDEFEGFIDRNDEAGALKWLESNFPNYKDVVAEELEKLKGEVTQAAPQILAASQAAAAGAPQQPMYAPMPPSQIPQQYQAGYPQGGLSQPGFPSGGPGQPGFPQGGPGQQQPGYGQPFGQAQGAPMQAPPFGQMPPQQYPQQPAPAQPASQPFDPAQGKPYQTGYPQGGLGQSAPSPTQQPPQQPAPMPQAPAAAQQPNPYQPGFPSGGPGQPSPSAPTAQPPARPGTPPNPQQFTPPPPGFTPDS